MTGAQRAINKHLKVYGLKMSKKIGSSFLSVTYDRRMVYSLEDLYKLIGEGFSIDTNICAFLFDAFMLEGKKSER